MIQQVVDEMLMEVGDEWAPIHPDYDEDFGVIVDEKNEPIEKLEQRLHQIESLLALEGAPQAKELAEKLVFSAMISALESFLWETMVYFVDHEDQITVNLVKKLPLFREQKIIVSDIYSKMDGLKDEIKAHLQNIVWHNWRHVGPLFVHGLEVNMPSFKQFDGPLLKRHDIVHRSGFTKDGQAVVVTVDEICELSKQILAFAQAVVNEISKMGNHEEF